MKSLTCFIAAYIICLSAGFAQLAGSAGNENFRTRIIKSGLKDPWEIVYGPDEKLWITESKSYKVLRVDPANGQVDTLLNLNADKHFSGKPWPQGGLMGLAIHPDFNEGKPFVYLAYISDFVSSKENFQGNYFKGKIVRYTYSKVENKLFSPVNICDTIPASNDHNGGRLHIVIISGKSFLFYSVGDMGAGQFDNGGRPNHAQDLHYYEGKVLRFNADPTGSGENSSDWIPEDNPFNANGRSAVYSFGHRNPQGISSLVVKGEIRIYSSEHGPYGDDELNLIEPGKNYGHPLIIGYPDGNYNGLAAGVSNHTNLPGQWHTTYPDIKDEKVTAASLQNYRAPLISFNPAKGSFLKTLYQSRASGGDADWAAEAPSGIEVYTADAIPGWKNSLLIATLKSGRLIRLKLSEDGRKIVGAPSYYFSSRNRYRDVAISPDGKKIYIITDNSSVTSGPTKEDPKAGEQRGAILEFEFSGEQ